MPARFPPTDGTGEPSNPAIQLYGRRFYKDQTPVEYLAEFLLVFASPKGSAGTDGKAGRFAFVIGQDEDRAIYWPEDRVALKLFAFFPTSKFDTRHRAHQIAYREALDDLAGRIDGPADETDETIRLLQSLFGGFVGVAKNRTWATYTFLPVSLGLLARELDWLHSKASRQQGLSAWDEARQYFATDRHNFMARGGEVLFLQLAHLFQSRETPLDSLQGEHRYRHVTSVGLNELRHDTESALQDLLENAMLPLNQLARFVESALADFRLSDKPKHAALGWVPAASLAEAHLFVFELRNVACSALADMEKLDLLQVLCCMQVLRTLCFQATREDGAPPRTDGFIGGYGWITANPEAPSGAPTRKLAQASFEHIEELLFRVLRKKAASDPNAGGSLREADKHGFEIFRRLGKQLGIVVPRTGKGQRFVLPPHLLRFLVAALLTPGEHVLLTEFYERVFAHYGIALGERQLAAALDGGETPKGGRDYAIAADTRWIEETLAQGGFLVELSDAVSMVRSPGGPQVST